MRGVLICVSAVSWSSIQLDGCKANLPNRLESTVMTAATGVDSQNTGVPFASRMSPPVPPLSSKDVQSCTDGQLKWVIDYGTWPSDMPESKDALSDDEIWSIAIYLRHPPAAGGLGEQKMNSH